MNIKERLPGTPVLIAGFAALAFMVFILYIQVGSLRVAWQDVSTERTSLAQVQTLLQNLLVSKEQYDGLRELLIRYDRLVPVRPDESVMLGDLETAADATGTDFNQIHFDNLVTKQGYLEMPFKLTFIGRYQELTGLVDHLQNGPRVIRIDEIKLGQGNQDSLRLKADITASAFYSPR